MRPRVLVLHPNLRPGGGSEAVGAWMIDALQDVCRVALVTWSPPDFAALNGWYGTSIGQDAVDSHAVSRLLRVLVDALPVRLALLRAALVMQAARRHVPDCALVISAENEVTAARTAVQYVHYPRFLRPRPASDRHWHHRLLPGALGLYCAACDRLAGRSDAAIAANVTLANSAWTAARVREMYPSIEVRVVYPPVAPAAPSVDWERRANGFVCIGRFAAEKDPEAVIDIVAAVRRSVPDVRLHFAGTRGTRAAFRRLLHLVRPHRSWIEIHENLDRHALGALVAQQRYGIHAMREEHFGIGPAEMAAAGSIVFLPDGGGQTEIVGGDARVLYRSREDAVAKILRVLGSADEQASIRAQLHRCADQFSAARFVKAIRDVVAGAAARQAVSS